MRILIVEDEPGLQKILKTALKQECFAVDVAVNGEQGSFLGKTNNYDIIILDNMLPKKDGITVCQEIRAAAKNTPILVLSALCEVHKKIELLEAGADDYMTKPFSVKELLARIRALMRRPTPIEGETLKHDKLLLDVKKHQVKSGNAKIHLTRKEFMLLEYFMKNKGMVLSRGMIMEHVWDINADPFSNTIESHIMTLRKKIGDQGRNRIIKTIPGRGYILD